ncbi:hypothetical protein [Sphingomonas faeni]|uniref:hypothetical protein n=1 Tax=Sphingomonas faeni TaxID=185950 RepID=UPI002781335B|nr:hypothetical protein [Sphingomonas faeni]MDQ0839389.1 hypothetical protein [Sphingomonas faeni]
MTTQSIQEEATAYSTFNPARWLHSLVQIGGGYALASDRKLWLVVAECPADELTDVMAQVVGYPERQDAVRLTIERRQNGELA